MTRVMLWTGLGILLLAGAFTLGAQQARGQGAMVRQLTTPPAGYSDAYLSFSPDGSRVAFFRIGPNGMNTELLVADALSGGTSVLATTSQLPGDLAQSGGIDWSPDGDRIAICAGSPTAIWMIDVFGAPVKATPTSWGKVKADYRK